MNISLVTSVVNILLERRVECESILRNHSPLEAFKRLISKVRFYQNTLDIQGQQIVVGTFLVKLNKKHQHLLDYIHKVHRECLDNCKCKERVERYLEHYQASFVKPLGEQQSNNPCNEIMLTPVGETLMNTNTLPKYQDQLIAQVTLVNGVDSSTLTEHHFIHCIQCLQQEIKSFEGLPDSHYIHARKEGLKKDITEIAKLMDTCLRSSIK